MEGLKGVQDEILLEKNNENENKLNENPQGKLTSIRHTYIIILPTCL